MKAWLLGIGSSIKETRVHVQRPQVEEGVCDSIENLDECILTIYRRNTVYTDGNRHIPEHTEFNYVRM